MTMRTSRGSRIQYPDNSGWGKKSIFSKKANSRVSKTFLSSHQVINSRTATCYQDACQFRNTSQRNFRNKKNNLTTIIWLYKPPNYYKNNTIQDSQEHF